MNGARRTLCSKTNLIFETRLSKMPLETRLAQAHVMLLVIPKDERDSKSVSLARYGAYEVRLVEPLSVSNTFVFWIELFDHSCQVSIDSGGAEDFEEALATAEYFVSRAEELSKKMIRYDGK
jgi:hypothetical protein